MSGPSLLWIDWRPYRGPTGRETAVRFLVLFLVASYFLGMFSSGGVDRFLAEEFTMTAILRGGVPDEEGAGIAGKVGALPHVREAVYRNPDEAWEEFLESYPGLESLRGGGRNPLPGYVDVRLRPGGLSEEGIEKVRSSLEPLPQVEKILSGGTLMPRLLRMKRWANALLWAGFALACAVFLAVLGMQERARAQRLLPDVSFLVERGVSGGRIVVRRAAGAAVVGAVLALLAVGASVGALHFVTDAFPFLRAAVGPVRELFDSRIASPVWPFLLSAAALQGIASLLAGSAAFPKGK